MTELRPSFEERDRYLDLLSEAYSDGRLDDVEFDRRTAGVLSAVTHQEALALFEGLPSPHVLPPEQTPPRPQPPEGFVPAPRDPDRVARRVVLIGAGVAGVLGLAAVLNRQPAEDLPFEMVSAAPEGTSALLDTSHLSELREALQSEGLTLITALSVSDTTIEGAAAAPRSPGEVTAFVKPVTDGATTFAPEPGDDGRHVDLDPLFDTLDVIFTIRIYELPGIVTNATLTWREGRPEIEVVVMDGTTKKVARYTLEGELIGVEQA